MKKIIIILSSVSIMCTGLFSSCANKNAQASAPSNTMTKEKTKVVEQTTTTTKVEESNSTKKATTTNSVDISSLQNSFAKQHAKATDIEWSKDSMEMNQNKTIDYVVSYMEDGRKNFITYSSEGKIIEEKHELLIDQLPQQSYNTIKSEYPNYKIVRVYSYKHRSKEGAYYILTEKTTELNKGQTEHFLREDGTIVK